MDKLEKLLKSYFLKKSIGTGFNLKPICPKELELSGYVDNRLSEEKREELERHFLDCPRCLDLVIVAREILFKNKSKLSLFYIILKNKWLILTGISFILSFIFHRYFVQCLVATILFGMKWVFSGEGTRNVMLIIRSLKDRKGSEEIKIYKNK